MRPRRRWRRRSRSASPPKQPRREKRSSLGLQTRLMGTRLTFRPRCLSHRTRRPQAVERGREARRRQCRGRGECSHVTETKDVAPPPLVRNQCRRGAYQPQNIYQKRDRGLLNCYPNLVSSLLSTRPSTSLSELVLEGPRCRRCSISLLS